MQDIKLKPLTRRALFALFIEGGQLDQRKDLRRLGLALTKSHREELEALGLATIGEERGLAITPAGREWVANQTVGSLLVAIGEIPALRGVPIRSMLAGVGPAAAASPPADPASDPVAEQAWRLADEELARALQEAPRLREAAKLKDVLPRDLRAAIGDAATFLRSAAERRRMSLVGEPGEISVFDEDVHSRDDPRIGPGVRLRVQRPGVRQGSGANGRMILKADVEPVDQLTE
jgi:hypothetical protein